MSNYTKNTDFAAKDALLSGDPAKIIKGTEIDTEYNAISVAISTKADTVSPTFTGTPLAPTAAPGTNTTQIATTAFVTAADVAERTATATLTNKTLTSPTVNGGTITGITDLTVADGGTGASSITANSVILGNGSSTLSGNLVAPSTTGNLLTSNGTTWTSAVPAVPPALSTASGSAPSYSARAWVNFDGTGTPAIRASGNVSSITDNNTGDYTVNFTTAMADVNYCVNTTGQTFASGGHQGLDNIFVTLYNGTSFSTGSVRVNTQYGNANSGTDFVVICVSVFR